MKVTALAGGVGGAKLLVGFDRALGPGELTAVVNTADDAVIYGVHVSPDVDIVTYWLAGSADTERGWGIRGDTFAMVDALGALGAENWFRLGDRDLATCIYRTDHLRAGATLSSVTDAIRRSLGVRARILPMSDDPVRTMIETADGRTLSFQEYFVRERTVPEVRAVRIEGADRAKPADGVIDALRDSDAVVVCPSNPLLSIDPILALPGVRDELRDHARVIAVTPIVGGRALKGPADRLLGRLHGDSSAATVARLYRDFCDVFVVDERDAQLVDVLRNEGVSAVALDTVMTDHAASERLATELLAL